MRVRSLYTKQVCFNWSIGSQKFIYKGLYTKQMCFNCSFGTQKVVYKAGVL